MPFTLAHPAAVLPFRRYAAGTMYFPALVIGSMAPDFVYFFRLGVNGGFSHSLAGLFPFCVPASLAVYVAYYLFLRQPMIALLPDAVAARLNPQPEWIPKSLRAALILVGAFAAGAATHLGWDAFTHGNTFFVRHVEVLRMPVGLGGLKFPLYNVLQHLSSVLGLAALAASTHRWMRSARPQFAWRTGLAHTQRFMVVAGIAVASVAGAVAGIMNRPARTFGHVAFNGVVGAMAWMMLAILVYAACWRILASRSARIP